MIPQNEHSLSNATYLTALDKGIQLTTYAGMFEVKTTKLRPDVSNHGSNLSGGIKKKVTTFSKKSQRNMQRAFIRKRNWTRPLFVTLTIPDEAWLRMRSEPRDIKRALDMLQKRFKRLQEDISHLWRIEWVTRKSGDLQGEIAPHYHLVLDNYLGDMGTIRKWVGDSWHEVLLNWEPDCRRPRTQVLVSKSRRHAMYYLAKYVTKTDGSIEEQLRKNEETIEEKFHNLHGNGGGHWGKSYNWNTSEGKIVRLSYNQLKHLKQYIAAIAKHRNPKFAAFLQDAPIRQGFSCYYYGDEYTGEKMGGGLDQLIEIVKKRNPHEFDIEF